MTYRTSAGKLMKRPELIVFDCDGVLVDSEAISARVLVQELAKFNLYASEQEVFDTFVGRSLTDVAESLQMPTSGDVYVKFSAAYHASLMSAFSVELKAMPGIQRAISQLDVPYCVATSSGRARVSNSLTLTGLDGLFGKNVFTASQVNHGKPAPDLFLFAANEMGVAPESCLVIEDSLPGVQAAQAAQMQVWRFTGGSHFAKQGHEIATIAPAIPTFDAWEDFFKLGPELKACVS